MLRQISALNPIHGVARLRRDERSRLGARHQSDLSPHVASMPNELDQTVGKGFAPTEVVVAAYELLVMHLVTLRE